MSEQWNLEKLGESLKYGKAFVIARRCGRKGLAFRLRQKNIAGKPILYADDPKWFRVWDGVNPGQIIYQTMEGDQTIFVPDETFRKALDVVLMK